MTVIERARVPKSIVRTYCAKPNCDGEGFYSARCHSAGHATEDVEYVPAEQLAGAIGRAERAEALLGRIYQFGLTDETADEIEALMDVRPPTTRGQ